MSQQVVIITALCLPTPEIEALIQGRTIAAVPRLFLRPGQQFALYPADIQNETITIKAWARCELCQVLDATESLEKLSPLTVWTTESLQEMLGQRANIFLAYLRVYLLAQPLKMSIYSTIGEKIGKFVGLPNSLTFTDNSPVLSESIFAQRRHQLQNRTSPLELKVPKPEITNPKAEKIEEYIKEFLELTTNQNIKTSKLETDWIKTINKLGTATTGGNYEKGTAFEQIVHKSLKFLGFELDPNAKGGAGGMDLYCTKPYPLLGECKAGKSIPGYTVYELEKLGDIHLNDEALATAVKLIIGPGQAASQLKKVAEKRKISIINPMTLQKLVELQAKYPGSVNLIELKPYLEAGQIDSKIEEYIAKVEKEIKLRSHIVQLVKKHLETTNFENAGIEGLHGAYVHSNPPQSLQPKEMHEILIEVSSPLTGYLGRKKGNDWQSDRFYYLRDLIVKD